MKTFRKILLVFTSLALVNTAMAQLKPDALGAFDKIVLDPKVKKIIIKKGSDPFIEIADTGEGDIAVTIMGSTLTLKAMKGNDLRVVVGNTILRRVEGRKDLEIEGVDYLKGGAGKYFLLGIYDNYERWETFDGQIAIDLEEETEIELDIEVDYEMQ